MREKGHLENQRGVVCCNLEYSPAKLKQLAGAERRLLQLGVGNHFEEEEEKAQPWQPDVALSVDSFCAALRIHSFWKDAWSLQQTFWVSILEERGAVWGAEEHDLGTHGLEEGPLQMLREAGR